MRLLAVFPHPDDGSLGLGGTLAKYSGEGVETYLVCATRGERGWNGPEEDDPGFAALGHLREAELRCAAAHLGLYEVSFLDYIDCFRWIRLIHRKQSPTHISHQLKCDSAIFLCTI